MSLCSVVHKRVRGHIENVDLRNPFIRSKYICVASVYYNGIYFYTRKSQAYVQKHLCFDMFLNVLCYARYYIVMPRLIKLNCIH